MKSNKELVFDFIKKYYSSQTGNDTVGLSTIYISEKLEMQRTNLSSILNALVKEGKIEKTNGRPVLYRLKQSNASSEFSCFRNLVGYNTTLKTAVQLAKASVLYPQHSLHSLIVGPSGSGKSFFAKLMFTFAQGNNIVSADASFVRFNCNHYIDNPDQMIEELYGSEKVCGALQRANNGFLVIDHVNILPPTGKKFLVDLIEGNYMNLPEHIDVDMLNVTIICCINSSVAPSVYDFLSSKVSVKINLPPLSSFSFEERYELIQRFFTNEATKIGRKIKVNSEVLRCLLLYDCLTNTKQLSTDIIMGCANAFVREFQSKDEMMSIYLDDFPHYVKQGILEYKKCREEVERLIPESYEYIYSQYNVETKNLMDELMDYTNRPDIYSHIEKKNNELKERGISQEDINMIVSVDIDTKFKDYVKSISEQVVNADQLSKIVDSNIIDLVNRFIHQASMEFNRIYPVSVFYGLCLHLNGTLKRNTHIQRLSNQQIMDIIETNKNEYAFSMKFASEFEKKFDISLPIDEVIFITMFICNPQTNEMQSRSPVVLYALHGESAATSIANTVNSFVKANNCYGFDMSLDSEPQKIYNELKQFIINIDRGKGVLMIYDMGSFKTMAEFIMKETNIDIRLIEMPITLFGLDCSRKASFGESVDEIHAQLYESYKEVFKTNIIRNQPSYNAIITLCMTGEGGALQIKNYIEGNMDIKGNDIQIIPLAISNRDELLTRINAISKEANILCVVGSFNPYLYNIPYISISELFNVPKANISDLLLKKGMTVLPSVDYDSIYRYLQEKFPNYSINTLRPLVEEFMYHIRNAMGNKWNDDIECGLLVHVACCIYRLCDGEKSIKNENKNELIKNHTSLYDMLRIYLKPIENEYSIHFDDDELATIISIIERE